MPTHKPGTLCHSNVSHGHSCSSAPPDSELHPFSEEPVPLLALPSSSLVSMATHRKVTQTITPLPLILCGFPPTQIVQVPSPAPSTTSQPCSVLRPIMDPAQPKPRLPCAGQPCCPPGRCSSLSGKSLLISNAPVESILLLSETVQLQCGTGRRCI